MQSFSQSINILWADLDPNFHVRHSVYYDWGASTRMLVMQQHGLTLQMMKQLHIGPILFREECVFRRELHLGDPVTIGFAIVKAKRNFSRWTIQHTIHKNPETVASSITVEGAWMDTKERKLTSPPPTITDVFATMITTDNFEWLD